MNPGFLVGILVMPAIITLFESLFDKDLQHKRIIRMLFSIVMLLGMIAFCVALILSLEMK